MGMGSPAGVDYPGVPSGVEAVSFISTGPMVSVNIVG